MTIPAVAVIGGSGGAGATVTAIAVCVALERSGTRALLLDLDPERGDLATGLGSAPTRSVADLHPVAHELTDGHLRAASVTHPLGIALVGGHPTCDPALLVQPLLALPERPVLVIDAGSGVTPAAREVSGRCPVLLVAPCDAAGCRVTRRTIELLGLGEGAQLIVNRGARPEELRLRTVARAVGLPVAATLLPPAAAEAAALCAGIAREGRRARLLAAAADAVEAVWGTGRETPDD
ncbi:MAG: hypothetical protein U0Y82_07875 [Thermoleophilia bacterium]